MFIPTWILIIVIAGTAFYYFRRHKNKNSLPDIHPFLKTAMEANNGNPTYDQMLKLDEKEFQQWLLIRNETDREKLLAEMIDHEERTSSLKKTARKDITHGQQHVLNIFDKEKSSETIKYLKKLEEIMLEDDKEYKSLIEDAIFAKAASDHVGLGEKMEKERK